MVPIFRHLGGKRRLAPLILATAGPSFRTAILSGWVEPFAGSGAVYGAAWETGHVNKSTTIVLNEKEEGITTLFRSLTTEAGMKDVIARVTHRLTSYNEAPLAQEALYYQWRTDWNDPVSECFPNDRAAIFVCLRQSSFNGLFRKNQSGEMNAAWGKRTKIDINGVVAALTTWSLCFRAHRSVTIAAGDFAQTPIPAGAVVYCDPPYVGTWVDYTAEGFDVGEYVRLLGWLHTAKKQLGVQIVISNSMAAVPMTRIFFPEAKFHTVETVYVVNRDGAGRVPVEEMLCVVP